MLSVCRCANNLPTDDTVPAILPVLQRANGESPTLLVLLSATSVSPLNFGSYMQYVPASVISGPIQHDHPLTDATTALLQNSFQNVPAIWPQNYQGNVFDRHNLAKFY